MATLDVLCQQIADTIFNARKERLMSVQVAEALASRGLTSDWNDFIAANPTLPAVVAILKAISDEDAAILQRNNTKPKLKPPPVVKP